MAIHMHSNETQNAWAKGNYKVMIKTTGSERPMGYCDGTDEDRLALLEMAENEGVHGVNIDVKVLARTMREVWTLSGDGDDAGEDFGGGGFGGDDDY